LLWLQFFYVCWLVWYYHDRDFHKSGSDFHSTWHSSIQHR
jgi:hypothetical protein